MAHPMHAAWQIAPAPALFVTGSAGAWRGEANAAALAWSVTRAWPSAQWHHLAEAIATSAAAVGQSAVLGAGWHGIDVDGGRLAWLHPLAQTAAAVPPPGRAAAAAEAEVEKLQWQVASLSERLDVAQDFGRIGIWERDLVSGVGAWDERMFRLFGLDPAAGSPDIARAIACVHPDDREAVRASYRRSLAQPGDGDAHFRVLLPPGEVMQVRSLWRVSAGPGGDARRVIGIVVDDTERLAALERDKRSLQQLTLAAGLAGIALWRLDLASQRIQYNDFGYRMSGLAYEPDGVPIDLVRASIHPDDREAVVREAALAIGSDQVVEGRARYLDRHGDYLIMLTRRVAQRDADGRVVALLGVSLDQTEQMADRARSEAFSARMELVAEATGIGVWSITLDQRERHWNGQMRRLFGVPEGAPLPSLRTRLQQLVVPEDSAKVAEMVARVEQASARLFSPSEPGLGRGQGADAVMVEVEFRIRHADGPVRWLVSRSQVLRQGDRPMAHGVVIDVSEFRTTQVELKLAQSRVELAARAAGLGTWELDFDTGVPHWDAQMYALRGLSPDDPRPIPELILSLPPPEDDPQVDARVAAAKQNAGGYSNEFRVRWPDGSLRWLASRGMTVADADGTARRMFGINWDITEQKRAEQMLREKLAAEEASRAKSELLARMSHELRTPLNAVIGFAELLCAAPPAGIADQERGHAELIRSAGRHLLALIDDVLDLARIDAARVPLLREPVALDAVLADVVRWVQAEARAAHVTVQAAASGLWVRGDAKSLRQVLANLLSNGIKYNRPGGHVQVRVASAPAGSGGAGVTVRVRDTGRGMAPEQLAHLFEPFNRLGAEGGDIEGTGIGLAIVHQLVERMGGRIEVRSSPGQGAEFTVWLPASLPAPVALADGRAGPSGDDEAEVGTDHASPATGLADAVPATRHALYIEDNPVNLLLVHELFARKPAWRLHTAVNGADGVSEALRLRPHLALIDMHLPDMNGAEVLARLQADPALRHTRCIALSANAMPDDVLRARAAGFDDYWTKPIDFQAFLAALDALAAPQD